MNLPAALSPWTMEDALEHLPCSTMLNFHRGQTIYNCELPSAGLYLLIDGNVKVSRITPGRREVIIGIYQPDEFFGESSLVDESSHVEVAVAIGNVKLMTWTVAEIAELSGRRPRLAIALFQLFIKRSIAFGARIESFAVDHIDRRLARTILSLADRLGEAGEDGSVQMMALTHEVLAQYVGTSREIITHYMSKFRKDGLLSYSRRGIALKGNRLRVWLNSAIDSAANGSSSEVAIRVAA